MLAVFGTQQEQMDRNPARCANPESWRAWPGRSKWSRSRKTLTSQGIHLAHELSIGRASRYEVSHFRGGRGMVSTSNQWFPLQSLQAQGPDDDLASGSFGSTLTELSLRLLRFKLVRQALSLAERWRLARKPKLRMRINPRGKVCCRNLRKNSIPSSCRIRLVWPVR